MILSGMIAGNWRLKATVDSNYETGIREKQGRISLPYYAVRGREARKPANIIGFSRIVVSYPS
jgi:hypothetical protein